MSSLDFDWPYLILPPNHYQNILLKHLINFVNLKEVQHNGSSTMVHQRQAILTMVLRQHVVLLLFFCLWWLLERG